MSYGNEATLTLAEWIQTLNDFRWRCAYCPTGTYDAMEHRIPIALGGGTTAANCVPACRVCNLSKRDRHPDEIIADAVAIIRVGKYFEQRKPPLALPAVPTAGEPYR